MPVTYVYTENSISEFRTLVNIIGANVGDLDRLDLPYPGNVDLVSAINALYELVVTTDSNVGDISLLLTNEKATTVGAINELWANAGPLPNLYTNEKGNLVFAINELWSNIGNLNTDLVPEGPSEANLYFTNARARSAITLITNIEPYVTGNLVYNQLAGVFTAQIQYLPNTDYLPETEGNLYFTNARAQAVISDFLTFGNGLTFDEETGHVELDLTSDDITEGNNEFFTDARARDAISVDGGFLEYDPETGVISTVGGLEAFGVSSVNGLDGAVELTSNEVPEGLVNLYFTDANWLARLSTLYTSNVAEDPDPNIANTTVGNVYFTNTRAWGAFTANLGLGIDYTTGNIYIDPTLVLESVVTKINGANGNVTLYTSGIPEDPDPLLANTEVGNVYFTNARARQALTVAGAATYDIEDGIITVPGPYGIHYRRYAFTLGAPTNTITGPDDNMHVLFIDQARATDIYVNGVKAIEGVDYTINNTISSSNVVFNVTLPTSTEVLVQELTGNLAVSSGYITEQKLEYLEPFFDITPASNYANIDLGFGQNTAFRVNVVTNINLVIKNPPVIANKIFVFTVFFDFDVTNTGTYTITYPENIRWDGGSAPVMSELPDVMEAITFFTMDAGTKYFGYKNLSNAPKY